MFSHFQKCLKTVIKILECITTFLNTPKVSLPHHGPQGQARPPEKKEVQRREAVGHQGRNKEVVKCRPHQRDSIPRMVGKCGLGKEGQREVEDVCGLHRPQQGMPEGLVPLAKHRRLGGQCLGLQDV